MPTGSQRMEPADAAWLHMDRPTNLMIVNSVFWFDERLDWHALCDVVEERLVGPFVRFRQKVVDPPVTLGPVGGPRWEFDPAFDLDRHIVRARLPQPGDRAALQGYVSDQASHPLERDRPLWELHLLDGFSGGGKRKRAGSAVLLRTHHAVADGAALIQLVLSLTDPESGESSDQLRLADPPPSPVSVDVGRLGRVVGAVGSVVGTARGVTGRVVALGTGAASSALAVAASPEGVPGRVAGVARVVGSNARVVAKLGKGLPAERNLLRGELGERKSYSWSEPVPLDTVRAAAKSMSGTINDVILTVVTGALHRYLVEHNALVDTVRAMVPVDLRPPDEPLSRELGNRFGLVFVGLPVGETDPGRRLATVQEQMALVKSGEEAPAMFGGISLLGLTPAWHENAWIDLVSSRASLIVTNVQGPLEAVRLAGTRLAGFVGWVPTSGPMGVGISVDSYAGALVLGIAADATLIPDPELLLQALEDELASIGERGGSAG